jgi:spermidine synthase
MKKQSPAREKIFAILFCFFLSGAAGLIYQVAWGKALGLIFGHTVYAVAIVLAVFMAGLAAGSAWFGSRTEARGWTIALYAFLEFLIALAGALSLADLAGVRWLYLATYPMMSSWQPLLLALRFFGAALVLFVPTFLMGGTLPILVATVMRNSEELGLRLSQLYWINTLGAASGTLLSGFALLPAVGLRLTIAFAVLLNLAAGMIALRIAKGLTSVAQDSKAKTKPVPPNPQSSISDSQTVGRRFLLFLFAATGFTAFANEIAWTRMLAIVIGSSTYAFTLMLTAVLVGTVIGSALFHRFLSRSARLSIRTLSWTQAGIGTASIISLALFRWIPGMIPPLLRATHETFSGLVLVQFICSALTVLPAAIVFGINFPLVIVLLARDGRATTGSSAMVGKAYAANTVGAIAGALLTGFLLVPWLGSFRVIAATAAVNLILALALDLVARQRRVPALAIKLASLAAVILIGTSGWFYNRSLMSLSAVLYGNTYQAHLTVEEIAATNDLVFSAEGVNDSIAVVRTDASVALRVNGKADASSGDARTQLLLGHLGAAFHPAPRRVLIIGFGGGMTASAVARYPDIEKIDCVEIEPAVLRAAPYLQTLNRSVLSDPRLHIIFDDARNFLLTSREHYDLIISEPSNPWIAGVASLFTDEYYATARQRLTAQGIFVQWVQAYALQQDDLRMIMASFLPHFADVTLWRGEESDFLLMGRADSMPLQFRRLRSLWPNQQLKDDFESVDLHQPEGLVAYFLLDDSAIRRLAQASRLNTDDRTLLEYHAPQSLLTRGLSDANETLINSLRTGPVPSKLDSSDVSPALNAGVRSALDLADTTKTEQFLRSLESQPPSAERFIAQGRLALIEADLSAAKSAFEAALKLSPDSLDAMHWLAVAEHRSGNDASAGRLIDQVLKRNPKYLPALQDQMQFAADRKDFRTALHAQLQRISLISDPPAAEYCRLGTIWMKISNLNMAETFFRKGLLKDPYSYACHLGLGEIYRETGRFPLARQQFEWIVRFFPDSDPTTFRSLAGVYVVLGDIKAARAILRKGHRIFPENTELRDAGTRLGE